MKIVAIMPTLGRPQLVAQSIRMFELQSYPDRELLVLDTACQLPEIAGDRWRIVRRPADPSFGTTCNAAIRMTQGEAIARWDDDDQYFPWHLSAVAAALTRQVWAAPSLVWDYWSPGEMILTETTNRKDPADVCYGGVWSFLRSAFEEIGGYLTTGTGEEDCEFVRRIRKHFGPPADLISPEFPSPSYCYSRSRSGDVHHSEISDEGRLSRRRQAYPPVAQLSPTWPKNYMQGFPADAVPVPRKW